MTHSIRLPFACNDAVERLTAALLDAGFLVSRSFDLQSARSALRVPEECPCPHHGTAQCSCQYVVLMVGLPDAEPVSVILHGKETSTHVSLETTESTFGLVDQVRDLASALAPVE